MEDRVGSTVSHLRVNIQNFIVLDIRVQVRDITVLEICGNLIFLNFWGPQEMSFQQWFQIENKTTFKQMAAVFQKLLFQFTKVFTLS